MKQAHLIKIDIHLEFFFFTTTKWNCCAFWINLRLFLNILFIWILVCLDSMCCGRINVENVGTKGMSRFFFSLPLKLCSNYNYFWSGDISSTINKCFVYTTKRPMRINFNVYNASLCYYFAFISILYETVQSSLIASARLQIHWYSNELNNFILYSNRVQTQTISDTVCIHQRDRLGTIIVRITREIGKNSSDFSRSKPKFSVFLKQPQIKCLLSC